MELVKMSAKGQLVVPDAIRKQARFTPGDRFVPIPVEGGVLFQRVSLDKAWEDFRRISGKFQREVKKRKLPPSAAEGAVRWARKSP